MAKKNRVDEGLLKKHLRDFWDDVKDFSRRVGEGIKNSLGDVKENREEKRKTVVKEFGRYDGTRKQNKQEPKRPVSAPRLIFAIILNLLIFFWVWISILVAFIGLFIFSFSIVLIGAALVTFSVFIVISYNNPATKDLIFSILFAGLGVAIFGWILSNVFGKVMRFYFKLTKKYLELNSKLIRK